MKKPLLAAAFLAGGLLVPASAHGGNYRGPGDTVPPVGGSGGGGGAGPAPAPSGPAGPAPVTPGAPAPVAPGAAPGATITQADTGGTVNTGPDLTVWTFWWEFNKEPYLNLKERIHTGATDTGSDSFFLGKGEKGKAKDTLAPTETQIRQRVVPALLDALENETNNDIVTGAMIALAKIGDANSESGESEFEQVIKKFLKDGNQEISETAAVSLGILASDKSIPTLRALLEDNGQGRSLVGSTEVDYRTRAFAAYGLGLIGAKTADEQNRKQIVDVLTSVIDSDDSSTRDIKVACLVSLGLVKLETIQPPMLAEEEKPDLSPHLSRIGQLTYLFNYLRNEENHYLVRAHAPTALARLIDGLQSEVYSEWRDKVVSDLTERMGKRSKEQREVVQSAVLAMGLLGSNEAEDVDLRKVLEAVPEDVADQQSRNFSLIALGKVGGTGRNDEGIEEVGGYLLDQLARGKSTIQPWAGLAIGVMFDRLVKAEVTGHPTQTAMSEAIRSTLKDEKDKQRLGAYAIAAGIMRDTEAIKPLLELLDTTQQNEARGYLAVALGLIGDGVATDPIREIVTKSQYRPELLKQAAIALGLLGDKDLVADLIKMLQESKGLATQAAISSALGFIGDQRSIDPLVEMLRNKDLTDRARGFAAVALGIVADKEDLPWNSKIAVDLNYRASTQTLVDSSTGTGILDIL